MTISGVLCCRNVLRLGYTWRQAGESLLGCCDELVLCDCDSNDGTREEMDKWAQKEPRINICNFRWTDPRGDVWWYPDWINYARSHAKSEWVLMLDADECVHEHSYDLIRDAANNRRVLMFKRHNFWRDSQHLIPHGQCCGHEVIRLGPQNEWMPSDYPDPRANKVMGMAQRSEAQIGHYGFLRPKEQFELKAREVQRIWANDFDKRLEEAFKTGGNWMCADGVVPWKDDLLEFNGTHPKVIHDWLIHNEYFL